MTELILVGAGGHAKSCIDVIEHCPNFKIKGLLGLQSEVGQKILGYEVLGTDDMLSDLTKQPAVQFLICLGQIKTAVPRKELFNKVISLGGKLATVISPMAYVSKHARLGAGTIVMHQAVVNAGAEVGMNVILNTKCLIEHDATIGDHCHISTAAIVNGGCVVEDEVFVGSNSVLKQSLRVTKGAVLSAGGFHR